MAAAHDDRPEDASDSALHRNERVARAATDLVVAELVRRGDLPPSALPRRDTGRR